MRRENFYVEKFIEFEEFKEEEFSEFIQIFKNKIKISLVDIKKYNWGT